MQIELLDQKHFIVKNLIASYRNEWQRESGQRYKERRQRFYISDVSKCDREIYYLFKHPAEKRTIADRTLVFFRHGNMYHEEIQQRLRASRTIDNARDMEYGLEDFEIDTTGRLDCFVREEEGLAVTELKSKNPYGFATDVPEAAEVDQLLWYIYAAKRSKTLRRRNILDHGYVLYMERGEVSEFPFRVWRVAYDAKAKKRVKEIRERFIELKAVIGARKPPQRTYERESVKCQYCVFREYCWQGVPVIEEAKMVADTAVEKPEMELVESAERRYVQLKREIAERETEKDAVYDLLLRYFIATGVAETELLVHGVSKEVTLDEAYLLKTLRAKWPLIARVQAKLIKQAIKDGEVDPETYERAKRATGIKHTIRIKKISKEAKNADKKPIKHTASSKIGKDTAGHKGKNR